MSASLYRARYRRIISFFSRVLISLAFWELFLPRLGLRKWVEHTRVARLRKSAARFRILAVEMGGVMIKVGQFLSSRVDVLPPEITAELAGLQDEVPAEDFQEIRQVVEAEFGVPLEQKYIRFDPYPVAAASLGQVHCAWIGEETLDEASKFSQVVVKVQRPHIDQILEVDLSALKRVGGWLDRYPPIRKRANTPALLEEFSRILHEEIDYLSEGRNAETFGLNFEDDPQVLVPGVIWSHTTRRVLTLVDVRAIKITDYQEITAAGIERREVAQRLLRVYLKQIFEDGFFHADPHPGNLFVQPLPSPEEQEGGQPGWQLTFVDFGMVGRLSPEMRAGMREMLIGVGTRDASRVVKSYQMLGMLLPGADLSLLEKAEVEAFERFWGKSMSELQKVDIKEMLEFANQFRELIYKMPFQVPEDLILLGRCVGILSGMCTGLDPEFNVWEGLAPFAQKLIAEEIVSGPAAWLDAIGNLVRKLLSLPGRTEALLEKMERGELVVHDPQLTRQARRLEFAIVKATGGVIFAALLLGGVQLALAGHALLAGVLLAGAGITLGYILWGGNKAA